jgi:2-dehydropantoate 2-reductase
MPQTQPSILVVGAGAVGAFFGAALAKQGARVSVVCRSDFQRVSEHGYQIRSALLGDHTFRPAAVLRETADCKSPPDYLLLTSKVLAGVDRAALIRPAVGTATAIVLIQNGVDIDAEIARAFPENELLSALALIGVGRTGAGQVHHQSLGMLILGRYPNGVTSASERLAQLFQASGVGCKLTENVVGARWQKAVWNAVFNPLSILGGVLDTQSIMQTPETRDLVRRAMTEVCAVATAAGHPIAPEHIDKLLSTTEQMGAYKTSMALDHENGRPIELEAILGNVVRTARTSGVSTPVLDTLYAIARAVDNKRTR